MLVESRFATSSSVSIGVESCTIRSLRTSSIIDRTWASMVMVVTGESLPFVMIDASPGSNKAPRRPLRLLSVPGWIVDMSETAESRLRKQGFDVDFLVWLEGREDRLPKLDQLTHVSDANFAAAVRAAVWLTSQFADPRVVDRDQAEDWRERYQRLEAILWNALRHTMLFHRIDRPKDLESLEEVLEIVLPAGAAAEYRAELHRLRRLGKPERLRDLAPKMRPIKRGGRKQSESVQRMRAAVEYLRTKSTRPYRDLAQLWNETLGEPRYLPDQIRQSLRKGDQTGPELLEFWRSVYQGKSHRALPGPIP